MPDGQCISVPPTDRAAGAIACVLLYGPSYEGQNYDGRAKKDVASFREPGSQPAALRLPGVLRPGDDGARTRYRSGRSFHHGTTAPI